MTLGDTEQSREYPSRLFFVDRLRLEVKKVEESGKSLSDVLDQLSVIWTAENREAVLSFVENQIRDRRSGRFQDELQQPVADALIYLVQAAEYEAPRHRQSADLAVSRIIKFLDPEHQLEVIAPWFQDSRKFRVGAVLRTLRKIDDLSPWADYLVQVFRMYRLPEVLRLIARTPAAARLIHPLELNQYFQAYITGFKLERWFPDRSHKYFAMVAAKVLILGEQTIPAELLRSMPEVFSWAIDDIGDPVHEPMLVFLIVENHESPELIWSALRTANRRSMPKALALALEKAESLLRDESLSAPVSPETTSSVQ